MAGQDCCRLLSGRRAGSSGATGPRHSEAPAETSRESRGQRAAWDSLGQSGAAWQAAPRPGQGPGVGAKTSSRARG